MFKATLSKKPDKHTHMQSQISLLWRVACDCVMCSVGFYCTRVNNGCRLWFASHRSHGLVALSSSLSSLGLFTRTLNLLMTLVFAITIRSYMQ